MAMVIGGRHSGKIARITTITSCRAGSPTVSRSRTTRRRSSLRRSRTTSTWLAGKHRHLRNGGLKDEPGTEDRHQEPDARTEIDKVVVHMGVGESGERLTKAIDIMKTITGNTPVRRIAKKTQPAFGIRKGAPIGCRVTLRGTKAKTFLETSLEIIEEDCPEPVRPAGQFFVRIEEHTDFPGMSYDPQIGIYGMDINVVLARTGRPDQPAAPRAEKTARKAAREHRGLRSRS